jgi:hypothetical protein
MALLAMFGRPPRHAEAVAEGRRRGTDARFDELSRRRRRAQIAARRALQL